MTAPIVVGAHPERIDLDVRVGVDFTAPVLDAAGVGVTSLAGWTVAAQIRAGSSSPLLGEFTVTIVGTSVHVTATAATTAAWDWDAARWDLHVLCAGWVRLYRTITH